MSMATKRWRPSLGRTGDDRCRAEGLVATRRNFLGGGAALLAALPAWAADDPSRPNKKNARA